MKKALLSVAGYDPTSGAGAVLDQNVFLHMGFHGVGILTSLTAQNTEGIKKVYCPPPGFLRAQYESLRSDVAFCGIKVGMIGCKENIPLIAQILSKNPDIPIVVDPVFRSSSGYWLLEKNAIPEYIKKIAGKASLLTPNIEEAGFISGIKVEQIEDMKKAAEKIYSLSRISCLVKGGHLKKQSIDLLYEGRKFHIFKKEKLRIKVHGTGCFLSSSLLGYLAKGNSLIQACFLATELTHKAIKNAISIGHGQDLITFPLSSQLH